MDTQLPACPLGSHCWGDSCPSPLHKDGPMADTPRPTNPHPEGTGMASVWDAGARTIEAWLGERLAAAEAKAVEAERERYAQLVEAAERAVVLLADCGTPKSRHGLMAALADLGEGQ